MIRGKQVAEIDSRLKLPSSDAWGLWCLEQLRGVQLVDYPWDQEEAQQTRNDCTCSSGTRHSSHLITRPCSATEHAAAD